MTVATYFNVPRVILLRARLPRCRSGLHQRVPEVRMRLSLASAIQVWTRA